MQIHREGYSILAMLLIILAGLNAAVIYGAPALIWLHNVVILASLGLFGFVFQFFRLPTRQIDAQPYQVLSPADGKVVVIEETQETEVLNGQRCRQLSIFMSPLDVHQNRTPTEGTVEYIKYHPGKYLVAWHPKSSTENERTTFLIRHPTGVPIVMRQIAGAVARRIRWYLSEGQTVWQGQELGFIKFGSRADIFLPLDAELKIELGQQVYAGLTVLAMLPKKGTSAETPAT